MFVAMCNYFGRDISNIGKPYESEDAWTWDAITSEKSEVDNTLEAEQRYVNYDEPHGLITVLSITDEIDVIANDEGKLMNYPIDRVLVDADGKPWDILVGNLMAVRHNDEGEFTSILAEDIPKIEKYLIPLKPQCLMDYAEEEQ